MVKAQHFLVVLFALLVLLVYSLTGYGQKPVQGHSLTRLSEREYVDLARVSFVRLPAYTPPDPTCPECQTRWGDALVVGSINIGFTPEAEAELKRLLNANK